LVLCDIEWCEGHPACKNPVVVAVSLSFLRAPGYPGLKGRKTVVVVLILVLWQFVVLSILHNAFVRLFILKRYNVVVIVFESVSCMAVRASSVVGVSGG